VPRWRWRLKKLFDSLKLQSFIKTSGGKGLHFTVPLNTPVTYEQTKPFAHIRCPSDGKEPTRTSRFQNAQSAAKGEGVGGLEPER
jgi:DNA primase